MIIEYPHFMLRWHNNRRGICGIEDYISDVVNKKYGYDLKEGQYIYLINYDGLDGHALVIYDAVISEISDQGVKLKKWQTQGWGTDDALYYNLITEDGGALLPWTLKDGVLQIEPLPSFYEHYKVKDLVNHTARLNEDKIIGGKVIADPRGSGLFYRHGGWRCNRRDYEKNIDNIVKLGQMELDLDV